jgi:hypothetical protein
VLTTRPNQPTVCVLRFGALLGASKRTIGYDTQPCLVFIGVIEQFVAVLLRFYWCTFVGHGLI